MIFKSCLVISTEPQANNLPLWSRISASNFTAKSTSVFNRNTFLTSVDAGVHTCNVRDADRRGGQASLEICLMVSFQALVACFYQRVGRLSM